MAKNGGTRTSDEFRAWLRGLRDSAGLTQDELAAAIGTDRRNIRRWESEGYDPSGSVLLRAMRALGVRIEPAPAAPGPVNVELQELRSRIQADRDEAASRHDELLARFDAVDEQLRLLSTRLEEPLRP